MADFVGTPDDDELRVSGDDANNRLFGRAGDDTLFGGTNSDRHFAGPGRDRADGGSGDDAQDIYHYVPAFEDLYIFDFASVATTRNRFDRLTLHTEDTPYTRAESLGLEQVRDAFFQLEGETTNFVTPGQETDQDENAYIRTDTGVIEIFDQYGGDDTADTQDGIEFISYRWTNVFGSTLTRVFEISSESDVFGGIHNGDNSDEFFFGARGDDSLFGNGGDDLIFTGAGRDDVYGGAGRDHIVASRGRNTLDGESSGDVYYWNARYRARNRIDEIESSDTDSIVASFAVEDLARVRIIGTADSRDLLLTTAAWRKPGEVSSLFRVDEQLSRDFDGRGVEYLRFDDVWYATLEGLPSNGTAGNDFIVSPGDVPRRYRARDGDDAVFARDADDTMFGQRGSDFLDGSKGRDVLRGGGAGDGLRGGPGGDTLRGGHGDDIADYGDSKHRVTVDLQRDAARGGAATGDRLWSVEGLSGSHWNDTLRGDATGNALVGDRGADRLVGRFGNDTLDGERGADRLVANRGRDVLRGGPGDDTLRGGFADDTLSGGAGDDVLRTGGGRDRVRIAEGDGTDVIRDWRDGYDRLVAVSGADRFEALATRQEGDDLRVRAPDGAWTVLIEGLDEDEFTSVDVLFPG